jgi:hypothetical protein
VLTFLQISYLIAGTRWQDIVIVTKIPGYDANLFLSHKKSRAVPAYIQKRIILLFVVSCV